MQSTDLRYRSLAGDVYPAEKLARRNLLPESCWDIEVIPPAGARLELRAIPFVGSDTGARGVCFEGDSDGEKV